MDIDARVTVAGFSGGSAPAYRRPVDGTLVDAGSFRAHAQVLTSLHMALTSWLTCRAVSVRACWPSVHTQIRLVSSPAAPHLGLSGLSALVPGGPHLPRHLLKVSCSSRLALWQHIPQQPSKQDHDQCYS